jgi:glycine oxidase
VPAVRVADVLVVGGGVIGAAVAWRCAQRGLATTVVDPAPGSGATSAAAGMLAPVTELQHAEQRLLALNLESARRYPAFAAEIEDRTGLPVGYRPCGTVAVAWDAADLAALWDLHRLHRRLGLDSEVLGSRELRRLEPGLATGLPGGLLACGDHQVDNRLLHAALAEAGRREGVRVVAARAACLSTGYRVRGVRLEDGTALTAGVVVLAAGAWSGRVGGVPAGALPPVRPVKGQTLRLRVREEPLLQRVVRGAVAGSPVYLVPRADGRVVVGASSEEAGFDVEPRAGAVYELLRDASALVPAVGEAVLEEVSTGLRPGTLGAAPVVGPTAVPGLVAATGHYRNGVLLAPVTADGVATLLADGALPPELEPFSPGRTTIPEVAL